MGEVRELKLLSDDLISSCKTELDAIFLCMHCAEWKGDFTDWAHRLGIRKSHMSAIKNGTKHFPTNKRVLLMQLAGNLAPLQYEASKTGCRLIAESLVERLKRENSELKTKLNKAA